MSRAAVRSGPPGGDPQAGPAGRHEVPFGPEISWPYGFRQMDPESRDLIESAFRSGPGYQQPAVDDYGYGDPGYSDPSYEGPKSPYNAPVFPGRDGSMPDAAAARPARGRPDLPRAGSAAYPEQWYGHPRLDDRTAGDGPRGSADPRPAGTGFLAAPVGLLMPPDGTRGNTLRADDKSPGVPAGLLTPPDAGRRGGPGSARPGHGLDGPEITSSWPAQPAVGDLDPFNDFWRDDADEEYSGLFGDRAAEFGRADARRSATRLGARRATGRRRGRSNDHRLWLGLGGVVVVAAAAIFGIVKFEFPSHSGPAHTMSTPAAIGGYTRTVDLERQTDVAQLRDEVIKMSSGQGSAVKSAVYELGNSAAGNTEQIVMFIGGHLANADPGASIASFTQKFPGAHPVSAGSLGGQAACVQEGTVSNAVAMCAWFDDDSFGEIVSPTMNATALAQAMQTFRPAVEQVTQK